MNKSTRNQIEQGLNFSFTYPSQYLKSRCVASFCSTLGRVPTTGRGWGEDSTEQEESKGVQRTKSPQLSVLWQNILRLQ